MFSDPKINFHVHDLEASARFYRDCFGFEGTFMTPKQGQPAHIELRVEGLIVGFASLDALQMVHGVVSADAGPRAEIVVWTDDVDEAHGALVIRGVHSLSAPHDFDDTLRAAWVQDIDGNPVQIVQRRAMQE